MIRENNTVLVAASGVMSAAAVRAAAAARCDGVTMKVGGTTTGSRTAGCARAMTAAAAVMGGREGSTVVKAAECSSASAMGQDGA